MLNQNFLNLVCLITTQNHMCFTPALASDCLNILNFYAKDEQAIPIPLKLKFDLCKTLSKMRSDGDNPEFIVDKVRSAGKYKELDNIFQTADDKLKSLSETEVVEYCRQVQHKSKLANSIGDFSKLKKFVEEFESNGFNSTDEALKVYETTIADLYSNYSNQKRKDHSATVKSLDLFDGDYNFVIDQIKENYSGINNVPTGYVEMDKLMRGGFQPSRLYIFAGTSNDGKSTLLVNFLSNLINKTKDKIRTDGKYDVYVYATFENLIDESLARLYCCHKELPLDSLIDNFNDEKQKIQSYLKEQQEKNKTIIHMEYFPSGVATTNDLYTLLNNIQEKYKDRAEIKGIFIDYLDLMKSGINYEQYRLTVGQIALDLKLLAITKQIPVITVTQLNRSGADKTQDLSLLMMSESFQKVNHSDFVGLLRAMEKLENDVAVEGYNFLLIEIAKNRSGPKNRRVKLKTNFSKYRIYDTSPESGGYTPIESLCSNEKCLEDTFDGNFDSLGENNSEMNAIL